MVESTEAPFIILSIIRLTGVILCFTFYKKYRKIRFVYMMTGWFFWGIAPLCHGFEKLNSIFSFLYGLFALIGTYLLLSGIILEFTFISPKVINVGALLLTIPFIIIFFLLPVGSFFILLLVLQALLVHFTILLGLLNIKSMKYRGGGNSMFWFFISGVISVIQTSLYVIDPTFNSNLFAFGLNYLIVIFIEMLIVSVEHNLTQIQVQEVQKKLLHSQKIEAIGQFAGEIAHDFNNILTVINGLSNLMIDSLSPENEEMKNDLLEISDAGNRAAALTKQLLTFSRKNIFEPRVININTTIKNVENMLERLIGEDILFIRTYEDELADVFCDPNQFEQVLMNLVINSRDAMPKGGTLVVKTANIQYSPANLDRYLQPGKYVQISISDTGIGMNEEQLTHVFEPFFTTKEKGKGTGLGLSTVYGIIKQSQGEISVYSQVGEGTIFEIYLPETDLPREKKSQSIPNSKKNMGGMETILLVEDEQQPRRFFKKILESNGYQVLSAKDPRMAIEIAHDSDEKIHLLLTDVILPVMNGKELADRLTKEIPNLQVLFMSGYTKKVMIEREILDKDHDLLVKPFSTSQLLGKVKNLLSSPTKSNK